MSEIDFHDSVMTLGLSENACAILVNCYLEKRAELRRILDELSVHPVQYHDLEWRLNVKVRGYFKQLTINPSYFKCPLLLNLDVVDSDRRFLSITSTISSSNFR